MGELYCNETYEESHQPPILPQKDASVNIYQVKENLNPNIPLKNAVSEFETTFGLWKQRDLAKEQLKQIEMVRLDLQFRNKEISRPRYEREKAAIRCVQVPLDGVILHNRLQLLPTIKHLDIWCQFLSRLMNNQLYEVAFMDAEGNWSTRTMQNQTWNQLPNNTQVQVFLCVEPWDRNDILKIYRCNVAEDKIPPATPTQKPKRKPGIVHCLSFYDQTLDRIETDANLDQKTLTTKVKPSSVPMQERMEPKRFMLKDITVTLVMTGKIGINRINMDNGNWYQVTFEGKDGHFSYSHPKINEWNYHVGKRVQVTGNKQDCGIFGATFFVVDYCLL